MLEHVDSVIFQIRALLPGELADAYAGVDAPRIQKLVPDFWDDDQFLAAGESKVGPFNYPIEVFAEWRGKAFYLNVRYRAHSHEVEDDFVVRHTRMTLTGFGRFDLAYFRHTDKWFTVYRGLTAADCFREIEENEIFWPTT